MFYTVILKMNYFQHYLQRKKVHKISLHKELAAALSLLALFLVWGCAPVEVPAEELSAEDLAALPADLQPATERNLIGQATYESCLDSDSSNPFDRAQLKVRSTTTFEGGSRTDRCYTWYAGTPKEKTRLIEGICREGRFQYWYADCSSDSRCKEGACVSPEPRCGNGAIEMGETCSVCPADVVCAVSEECRGNMCVNNLWQLERVISNLNYVQKILISSRNENSLIAMAGYTSSEKQGVYISDDGGASWRKTLGNEEEGIQIIVAHSNDVNTIYAGTYIEGVEVTGKLYISNDFGQRWDELAEFRDGAIRNIHIDRSNPLKIYVFIQPSSLAYEAGVYISNDGGITWEFHSFGFPSSYRGTIVWAVEQNLDGDLFLGIELDRTDSSFIYRPPILRSQDGGITWENIFQTNPWHIYDIIVDDLNNIIYFHEEGARLYISSDNGNMLNELANNPGAFFLMALNKNNPDEIFFGSGTDLWLTTNKGETFVRAASQPGWNIADIVYNQDYTKLYVAAYGQGIVILERINEN